MALEGLGDNSLKNVVDIKNNISETGAEVRNLNKEFQQLGIQTVSVSKEFSKITQSAGKFADLQKEAAKSSKATFSAIKEENKQRNVAKELSLQIADLNARALRTSEKEAKVLYSQAAALGNAKSNAISLADSFSQLAEDSASIDRRTEFFTGLSEVTKDIPGLRKLSGPFQEAAKASRQTVIDNAKSKDITAKIGKLSTKELKTGKGLSKERLKQMGLSEITGKSSGTAAASTLKKSLVENKARSVGLAGMKAGFKALGPLIRTAFGPIGIIFTVVAIIKAFVDQMFKASAESAKLQRDLGLSADSAQALRERTYDIANNASSLADTQGEVLVLQKQILEQLNLTNQAFGTAIDFTKDLGEVFGGQLLTQSALLTDNLGLSAEAVGAIQKESVVTGESVEDIAKSSLGISAAVSLAQGPLLDLNSILEESGKLSGELRLNFKNSTAEIAKGLTATKRMGFELKTLNGAANTLLDFESSLKAEMEAEMFLQRDLNLEKARQAALDGDLVTVGEEINKQGVDYNELQNMSVLGRRAFAKAVGLSVDDLSDQLKKQDELNALQQRALAQGVKIADVEKQSLKQIYEDNKKIIGSEEELRKVLGDAIYERKLSEDAQTKFNKILAKTKDQFASFVDSGALDKFATILTVFADTLSSGGSLFSLLGKSDFSKNLEKNRQANLTKEEKAKIAREQAEVDKVLSNPQSAASFGQRADFGPKMATGGIVNRATSAIVGEAGPEAVVPLNEFYKKIDELIVAVKSGGDIYLDGQKVGNTLSTNYRTISN